MCAAISSEGMVLHEPLFWLYNTESLITFLANLYGKLVPTEERWQGRQNVQAFIIIRDSVAFYSFATHPLLLYFILLLLSSIEEDFLSSWMLNLYGLHPYEQMSLLDAIYAACLDISVEDCQRWVRHAKRSVLKFLLEKTKHVTET